MLSTAVEKVKKSVNVPIVLYSMLDIVQKETEYAYGKFSTN
jgi:hypothetical protein